MAPHLDLEPEHPRIGAHQPLVLGLRDENRVGPIAPQMGHERAVAGGFLLDHGLHVDGGGGLEADAAQGIEAGEVGRVAGLHVGAAAPMHPAVPDHRIEGRVGPQIGGPGRHHVHVGLEDEGASALVARTMDAHHDGRVRVAFGERSASRMGRDRPAVHGEPVQGEAPVAQGAEDEILDRVLLAP
jgi:hypothetical protein